VTDYVVSELLISVFYRLQLITAMWSYFVRYPGRSDVTSSR